MFSVAKLTSERKCRMMFAEIVFSNKLICPACKTKLQSGKKYYWCSTCRKKLTPRSFTPFKHSKLPYRKILIIIHAWQKNLSPGSVKHLKGISYTTIARWYSKLRSHLPQDREMLEGIIEVDEAFFGRRKYFNQRIVIGGIDRKTKRIKLREIPDREQDSIEYFLTQNISSESYLNTDCHTSYYDIVWYGYGHNLHNHSKGHFKGTNRIENVWSVAKRQIIRVYGQIRIEKLEELLVEWEARFNFPELFKNPLTYLKGVSVPY